MAGGIGWYRKDFELPSADCRAGLGVPLRVGQLPLAGLAQRHAARREHRRLHPVRDRPPSALKRKGTNRLVVRVDSRRKITDFPPAGLNTDGVPTGGWWNYSGIQREVYLRKLDTVDFQKVLVRPVIDCATCAAQRAGQDQPQERHRAAASGRRSPASTATGKLDLGTQDDRRRTGSRVLGHAARSTSRSCGRRSDPQLYDVSFTVRVDGKKVAGYSLHSGIRSIKVVQRPADPQRPVPEHPRRRPARGLQGRRASRSTTRAATSWSTQAKELGATVLRTHYPLHPYTHELADRLGLLIWSEIPVYSVKTEVLKEPAVRRLAVEELRKNINANENHPSVMLWSIGNELSSQPGPVQVAYINAAVKFAKQMDPTRPVGLAVAALPELALPGGAVQAARRARPQRLLRLVPGPERADLRPHEALRLPRRGPRLLPEQGADGHRVRRRGQPRRPGRGEGHLGLPAGLDQLPARRVRAPSRGSAARSTGR